MTEIVPDKSESAKPGFLERVRRILRTRHYSLRTEEAYLGWIKRLIVFHGKRHPEELGEPEIVAFLNYLANQLHVATTTQNTVAR